MTTYILVEKDDPRELVHGSTRKHVRGVVFGAHALLIAGLVLATVIKPEPEKVISVRMIAPPPSGEPAEPTPQPQPDPPVQLDPPKEIPKEVKKADPPKVKDVVKVEEKKKPKEKPKEIKKPDPPKEKPKDPPKEVKKKDPPKEPKKSKYKSPGEIKLSDDYVKIDAPKVPKNNKVPTPNLPNLTNSKSVDLTHALTSNAVIGTTNSAGPISNQNYATEVLAFLEPKWSAPLKSPSGVVRLSVGADGSILRWTIVTSGSAAMKNSLTELFNNVKKVPAKEVGPFPHTVTITFSTE